ncbi:MAG: MgtC/SapB family protein [Candidatus Omnitrophica bacterium]|nr:MgtC/SapB family protein [Candidatus Omnitrophota bacterium]
MPISDREVVARLLLAVLFSGLIGLEREVSGRAAGFRTHILVCVGSALMMLTGMHLFAVYHGLTDVDPGRIAAQVVSGIGFLGAGTIIQYHDSVRGLTTAASLWAAAGIGLAVGSGFYVGAVAATGIVLIVLYILSVVEHRLVRSKRKQLKEDA